MPNDISRQRYFTVCNRVGEVLLKIAMFFIGFLSSIAFEASVFFMGDVLIERAHYYAILSEEVSTNRGRRSNRETNVFFMGGVLINYTYRYAYIIKIHYANIKYGIT